MESKIINALRTLNVTLSKHTLEGKTTDVIEECKKREKCDNGIKNVFDILYWISYMQWEQSKSSNIPVETTIDQMNDMIREEIPTKILDIEKMKNISVCLASVAGYLFHSIESKDIHDNLYTPSVTK